MIKWIFVIFILVLAVSGCKSRYVWNDEANRCMDLSKHWQFVPDKKCDR